VATRAAAQRSANVPAQHDHRMSGRRLPFLEPTEHRLISTQPVCQGWLCQAHDTFEELLQAIAPDRAGCETSIIGTFRRPLDP
jgi:hypothetical protein